MSESQTIEKMQKMKALYESLLRRYALEAEQI